MLALREWLPYSTAMKGISRYGGQWVALRKKRVVGHSRSLDKLVREMEKEKQTTEPTYFLVPRKSEGPYVL